MTQQWKMIYLVKRNPALSAQEFPQAWREHSALGSQCHNVRDKVKRVTQCSRVLDDNLVIKDASVDFDGVNLLLMTDKSSTEDIWTDEETLRIMRPDEPRVFATYIRDCTVVCTEQVLKPKTTAEYCVQLFLKTNHETANVTNSLLCKLITDWLFDLDNPITTESAGIILNKVYGDTPSGYDYSAVVECWFESLSTINTLFTERGVWQLMPAELRQLINIPESVFMLTQVTHRRP